jgi:hypothetical protein
MLQDEHAIDEIASALDTTHNNIWKTTTNLRRIYLANNPRRGLPEYLRDRRRRQNIE